jgi:hypothetical protein
MYLSGDSSVSQLIVEGYNDVINAHRALIQWENNNPTIVNAATMAAGAAGGEDEDEVLAPEIEDDLQAKELGYNKRIPAQKAPFNSHGQSVYERGNTYITRDVGVKGGGSHSGGYWKVFQLRGGRAFRIGTYNEDLTERIGK